MAKHGRFRALCNECGEPRWYGMREVQAGRKEMISLLVSQPQSRCMPRLRCEVCATDTLHAAVTTEPLPVEDDDVLGEEALYGQAKLWDDYGASEYPDETWRAEMAASVNSWDQRRAEVTWLVSALADRQILTDADVHSIYNQTVDRLRSRLYNEPVPPRRVVASKCLVGPRAEEGAVRLDTDGANGGAKAFILVAMHLSDSGCSELVDGLLRPGEVVVWQDWPPQTL